MSNTLDAKVDLMLALLEDHSSKLNQLVKKYGLKSDVPKWVTTGELAQLTNSKSGTITSWICNGKIPKTIIKKKIKGKTYNWLIDSEKGRNCIECIKAGQEYCEG